jgi:hypothetical protein
MRCARLQGCGLFWRGQAPQLGLNHVSPRFALRLIGCPFDCSDRPGCS